MTSAETEPAEPLRPSAEPSLRGYVIANAAALEASCAFFGDKWA